MPSIDDLTRDAGFIFEGQITQLGASTAAGYPGSPDTAIVRVSRIVKGPDALSGYVGQLITVHMIAPGRQANQEATFFTHGIHYGEGLVVGEVGVPDAAPVATAMAAGITANQNSEMEQRLAAAELVVSGVASEPQPFTQQVVAMVAGGPVPRISEHDPDWWSTTIAVDAVEKGDHSEKSVRIVYPNSRDIAWYRAPKIKAGDRGVFLLHNRDHHGKAVPALAVTHPLDFHPTADAPRVLSLLKGK
jgi:hypothetical protein